MNQTDSFITSVTAACTCKLLRSLPDRLHGLIDHGAGLDGNHSSTRITLTANGVGYRASRIASLRDPSWRPFSSTSTLLTCQPPPPESMLKLLI